MRSWEERANELHDRFLFIGLDWTGKAFLFADHAYQKGKSFVAGEEKLRPVDYQSLKHVQNWSVIDTTDGQRTLALNQNLLSEDWFRYTGFHEAFHIYFQHGWKSPSSRGIAFPYNSRPRYLRALLYNRMLGFFNTGKAENLQKAKYWFNLWKKEFPDDFDSTADTHEGTAHYFLYHDRAP